jgi:MoaA/NifB/PqqE/SkfB family radical SAM enzyme
MISHYLKNLSKACLTCSDNLFCYLFNKNSSRGPLFVNWDITYNCNAKCIFCDRWKIKGKELSTGEKLNIIRQLGSSGVWFLSLCGGEPLLTKDLDIILKEIKKQGMLINISTNGSILKEKAKLLVDSGVDFITVSVQSYKPELHDSITGFKGLFKRVDNGIDSIKKIRKNKSPKIFGRLVINDLVISDLNNFLSYWRPKFDEILLQPIFNNPKMWFKTPENMKFLKKSKKEFDNFYHLLKIYNIDNLYNRLIPKFIFEKKEIKKDIRCFAGYFFLTLDAEGNVYSCSSRYKKLGNFNNKFLDILNSRKMKDFRDAIKNRENNCVCWHSGSMLNVYLSKVSNSFHNK